MRRADIISRVETPLRSMQVEGKKIKGSYELIQKIIHLGRQEYQGNWGDFRRLADFFISTTVKFLITSTMPAIALCYSFLRLIS